ncbi:MAG TPA: hypothetical protein VFQ65_03680 [Kofleriaceae bacterium]|nr:hypothetical protein [Kofleriaceae bacterium]
MLNVRFGIACALLVACGGKKDAAPAAGSATPTTTAAAATPAAPAGTPAGKCSFTVTGDLALNVEAVATKSPPNGKAMATADYWQTDEQLRSALHVLAGLDSKKSKDAVDAEVDAEMKRDPKFMLLLINCGADLGSINLGPGKASKYADIPFKPGKYPIASDAKAGEIGAMIMLRPPGKHNSFKVSEPGTLELTKFDATGITGTFTIKAKSHDDKQAVEIKGSFDYPCVGAACKS